MNKKQNNKRNKSTRQSPAYQIPKGMVKALRNANEAQEEKKYYDAVTGSAGLVTYNGTTPFSLSDVAQGSSDTNRVGDLLTVKRLRWKSLLAYNGNATVASTLNLCRLVIFCWKPFFTDVNPTVAKIMTYTGTAYAVEAPLTHDGIDQFRVLHDKVYLLDAVSNMAHLVEIDLKLDHNIQYKAASTTNQAGGIYALWISNTNGGAGTDPSVQSFASRIDFVDC